MRKFLKRKLDQVDPDTDVWEPNAPVVVQNRDAFVVEVLPEKGEARVKYPDDSTSSVPLPARQKLSVAQDIERRPSVAPTDYAAPLKKKRKMRHRRTTNNERLHQ